MIKFNCESDLQTYVDKAIAIKLQEITRIRSLTYKRKSRGWEPWEDTYLVDQYLRTPTPLLAATLSRTPASVAMRITKLRKMYGLPNKRNMNGKCFTFKT